ncbi:hypothetical protein Pan241w_41330 [Gimesia alba]|uniref:Transposase n=1 Tax=Gimesia alba TaxID=2527973 RepID=A0A517RJI7_9PLAN|nr:hypothetical protein Pan241w_41330 [Gimesia alba]
MGSYKLIVSVSFIPRDNKNKRNIVVIFLHQVTFPSRFLIHAVCERFCYLVFTKRTRSMKRKRYTEEQIAFTLHQAESGTPVAEVTRKMGISE